MLGKTCLPCLPQDVGEDTWGCWGRHSEMSGKTEHWGRHSRMPGKTLGDVWDVIGGIRDVIRASRMSSGHQDIKDVIRDVRDIIGDVREDFGEDGDDMSSLSSLRCRGSHVFPIFPNILRKTCLPHLPLRCWGKHLGMLGKTLRDVGEDRNIGKTLKDAREDTRGCLGCHRGHQGCHQGIGTSRMSSGMLGTSLVMSGRTGKTCRGRHVFPGILGKTCLPCLP